MPTPPKVPNARRRPPKSAQPRLPRPELTPDEVALLTSRFDAGRWDATADADRAAEEAAATDAALPHNQPKKRAARA